MSESGKPLGQIGVSSAVLAVIEKQVELTESGDSDEIDLAAEHLELERLENVVEEAAFAMTTVPLRSVSDIVALLALSMSSVV